MMIIITIIIKLIIIIIIIEKISIGWQNIKNNTILMMNITLCFN